MVHNLLCSMEVLKLIDLYNDQSFLLKHFQFACLTCSFSSLLNILKLKERGEFSFSINKK